MSGIKLNQIFLLHSVKFVCEALRVHAKNSDVSIYTLDGPTNLSFFIEDMKPQVVLIREEDLGDQLDAFLAEFKDHPKILKVLWSKSDDSEMGRSFDAVLSEPISPRTIFSELEGLLESYVKSH